MSGFTLRVTEDAIIEIEATGADAVTLSIGSEYHANVAPLSSAVARQVAAALLAAADENERRATSPA